MIEIDHKKVRLYKKIILWKIIYTRSLRSAVIQSASNFASHFQY
jgi:hypothetical protein